MDNCNNGDSRILGASPRSRLLASAEKHFQETFRVSFKTALGEWAKLDGSSVYVSDSCISLVCCVNFASFKDDPHREGLHEEAVDCWFVEFAAGDMAEGMAHLPFYLPMLAFTRARDGRLRSYASSKFYNKVKNGRIKNRDL